MQLGKGLLDPSFLTKNPFWLNPENALSRDLGVINLIFFLHSRRGVVIVKESKTKWIYVVKTVRVS